MFKGKVIENNILTLSLVNKKIINIFEYILIYKAKQFMLTKIIFKKSTYLEDGASGDIEQVIVKKYNKIQIDKI